MEESEYFDATACLEALKATRELDGNLKALQGLRKQLSSPQALSSLLQLIELSPTLPELANVWTAHASVKNQKILAELLSVYRACLEINAPSHSQASKTCSNNLKAFLTEPLLISHRDHDSKLKSSQSSIITDFQQSMASFVIKNKMKSLYQALGSDNRLLVNSALGLMVSVAHHSPATASGLAAALDFSLPALSSVAKPPRPFHSKGDKVSELVSEQQVSMPCHGPAYWETWLSSKLSLRPSRSLFLDLGCSMLERCDHLTLSKLLSIRSFMSSMLLHLASDPPSSVVRMLKILATRVLLGAAAAGNTSTAIMTEGGLGATVRLGVFTDGVLLQLAESVVVFEDFAQQCVPDTAAQTSKEEEEGGLSRDCVLAASASEELLGALLTDPHHGLAPKSSGDSPFLEAAYLPGSGSKRILRLLPRLQPTSSPGHARLLQAVAELQPAMAAEFVSSLPYNMEPAATSKWVATAVTVSGLLSRIASAPPSASSPQIHQLLLDYRSSSVAVPRHPLINNDQAVAPHAVYQSAAAIIRLPLGSSLQACSAPDTRFMFLPPPPPALDSQLMRSHLRRCLPPSLSKAVLSRGLQHPRQAVQLLTLQLLEGMLRCLVPLMELSYQAASQEQQLSLDLPSASFQPSELVVGSGGGLHVDPHLSPSYKDPRARAEPAAADLSSSTCWRSFMNDLSSFVRLRVPDPHTLMALHASLEKQQKVAGQQMPDAHVSLNPDAGKAGDRLRTGAALVVGAPSKRALHNPSVSEAKSTRKRAEHSKSEQVCPSGLDVVDTQHALLVQGLSGPAGSGSAPQKKSHDRQPEQSDVGDPDLPELEASLFGEDSSHLLLSAADGAKSSKRGGGTTLDIAALVASGRIERIIMLLLKVLTLYRRFQRQAMDDAHFDSSKFVPEDVLSLPEPRQLAILDLIQADSESSGDGSLPGFSDKASGSFYRSGLSVAPSLSTNSVINNALDSVTIMGSNRRTLQTGISASALLSLIRLTCLGSSGRVREVAADLAAVRIREVTDMCCTSLANVIPAGSTAKTLNPKNSSAAVHDSEHAGTPPANAPLITDPHRFDETLLFLGMLPRCSSSHALKAKLVVQKADNVSAACVVAADGEDASGVHKGSQLQILQQQQEVQECEAVSNFLTNTVVQLMRRPHETYELVQEALHGALVMPAAGGASHGNQLPSTSDATKRAAGGTTAGNKKARISGSSAQQGGTKQMGSRVVPTAYQQYLLRASQSVGILTVAALRSCLKAASSSRMPSHEKTAICAFTSSVIHGQLRVQRDCLPLMLMFRYILVAECSSQKQQAAQQRQEGTECFQDSKVSSSNKDLSHVQATAAAAGSSSPPDEAGATLKLPFEAKCLWAVYQAGVVLVSELGRTSLNEASAVSIRASIESLKQLQAEVMSTDAASNDQLEVEATGVAVSGLEQPEPLLTFKILAEKVLAALQGAALSSDAAVVPAAAAGSRLLMGHEHPSVKPGKKRRMSRGAPEEASRCAPEQDLRLQLFQLKQAMRTASATELRSSAHQLLVFCAALVSSSGCPTLGIKGREMPAAAAAGGSLSLPGGNAMPAVQSTVTWKDRRLLAIEILHALCFSMMSKGLVIGDIMDDGDDDNGAMCQTLAEALMIASLRQAHAVDGMKDDMDVSSATLTKPLLAASHNAHRANLPMLLHLPSVLYLLGRLQSSPSVTACCEEVRHGLRSLGATVAPDMLHIVLSAVLSASFTSPRQVSLKSSQDGEHRSSHNLSKSDAPHVAAVPVHTSWEHHLSTLKALLLPTSSSKAHIIHLKGTATTLRTLFQDMDILHTEFVTDSVAEFLSHESPERVQHDVSCCTAAVHMLESLVATAGNSSTVSSTCPLHGTYLLIGPSIIAADPSSTLQTHHESSGGLGFMSELPPSPNFCLYCSAARRTVLHAVLPLVQAAGKVVLPLLDGAVAAINSDPVALSTLLGRKRPKQQLLPSGHSTKKGRRHGTLEAVEKLAGPWTQYLNSMVVLAPHLYALDLIGLAQKVLIVARYIVTLKGQTLSTSTQNKLTTDNQLGYKGKEIRNCGKLGKGGHKRDTPHAGGDDEGGRFIDESSLMLDPELDHFHQTVAVAMMLSAIAFEQQQDSNIGGGNGGAAGPETNTASLGAHYQAASSPHHKIEVKAGMQHQQAGGGSTSCTAEVLLPSEDGSNTVSLAELLESCQEFLRLLIPVLHHSPSFVIRARDQLINSLMMIGSRDAVIDYSGHHSRSAMHLMMNPASSSTSSTLPGLLIASPSHRACLPSLTDSGGINSNLVVLHKLGQEGRVQSQYQRQKDSGQRLASKLDWVLCVQAVISHPTRAGAEAICQSVPATSSELGAAARMVIQALSPPTAASQQGPLSPESKDRKASKETGGSEVENLVSTAAAAAERRRLHLAALLPVALKLLQNAKASADKALKWSQGSYMKKYTTKLGLVPQPLNPKGKAGTTDLCQGGLRYAGSPACAQIPKWAEELSSLYQAPLIAYAQRKRKKTANTGLINHQGSRQQQRQPPQEPVLTGRNYGAGLVGLVSHDDTINEDKKMGDDDVSSALRSYAVPVLLQCLEVSHQGLEEGERRRLVEGLLPEGGLSLEDVRGQPVADSVQQLALGVSLIMKAVADEKLKEVQCGVPNVQQGFDPQACCKGDIKHGGEQDSSSEAASGAVMGTLLPLLICCCSTLSRLCTERGMWRWPEAAHQQCRSTLSAADSRDAVSVEATGQLLGMRECWRHESLSMALINCLDGPVGDLVSELKDADRTGDTFTAASRAAATLGASVLQYAGGTAVLVRCVRRLVAALLPAGSEDVAESEGEIKEEEEELEEEGEVDLDVDVNGQDDAMDSEDILSDDVGSQDDGDDEFPVDKQGLEEVVEGLEEVVEGLEEVVEGLEEVVEGPEEVFEDSEAKSIDSLDNDGMAGEVSGMEGSEVSEEEDQMEVEGINERSGDEDEGLNNADEEEVKDPVNSGDAPPAGRASPKMQQQRLLHEEPVQDFSVELSQPALPDIPHVPNPEVAACSSWLLQHLIKYSPLFNLHPTDQLSSLTSQPTTNTADSSHAVNGPAGPSHAEEPSMSHHGTVTFAAPLPACVAQLATPIHSALDAISTSASSHGIGAPPSATASSKGRLQNEVIHGSQLGWLDCTADSLNLELLLLLESLIDMRRAFDSPDCKTTFEVPESGCTTGSWPEPGTTDAASLEALLRLLQCCYGASLSPEDRACLRIMFTLDVLLQHGSSGHSLLSSRLSGPLARSGYLWGQAAKQYYGQLHSDKGKGSGIKVSAKVQSAKRLNADSDLQPNDGLNTAAILVRVLKEECPPEVRRAVLTTVWFPSGRTASGDDEEEGAGIAEDADPHGRSIKSTWLWPEDVRAAAFDPAYLLLFSLSCLGGVNPLSVATRHQGLQRTASGIAGERERILDVTSFVHWGLLALCLRCLAAKDVFIRALAYECLSLFTQLLESSDGTASAASPQLQALLSHVRQGVPYPLARLSSSSCLLASEASFTLSSPTAPAYALVNRAILRKEAMGSSDAIDLALRLMGGGTPQYRMEQSWAARLLYAGILDGQDADLYRRKYIVEIVSAIHDGPSVETAASSDNNEVAFMLLGTLLSAAAVPSFAKYLVLQTGAVPWLCNKIVEALSSNDRMLWLTTQTAKNSPHTIAAQSSTKYLSLQLCVNILHALVARFLEVEMAQGHQADMKESGHALCKHDSAERLPEGRTRGAPLCISLAEIQLKPFVCELLGAGITLINAKGRDAGCKGLEASDSSKRLMHLLICLRNQLIDRQ